MLELDITKKNPMLSFMVGAGVAYLTYYLLYVVKKPLLACNDAFREFLHEHMPITCSNFWPTFWCLETRAQTILRSLYKSNPQITYERELLDTPDGGVVALDWTEPSNTDTKPDVRPTVLVLPGLTGSSAESYALHFVKEAKQLGYRSVVFNNRGNGGAELKTPRTYNAANTEDLTMVVDHIKALYPNAPIIGVGVSLGGLILANYLAKTGRDSRLVAGMTVSAAWNVFESAKTMEQPLNKFLFNRLLTNNLVENVKRYEHMFRDNGDVNMDDVYESKTIRDFDERFTSKVFGYKTNQQYYIEACIHEKLHLIEIPLLCLNAADDVFSPEHAIPVQTAQKSRYVCIMVTQHGGHIGFLEGINPRGRSFMDRVYAQFIEAIFKHGDQLLQKL